LAVDPESCEILAPELTTNGEGDASLIGPLLDQIDRPIASVMADGAYDGDPVCRAVAERQPDPPPAVIIPPRATAVPSPIAEFAPSQRDGHFQMIHGKGRMAWQKVIVMAAFARGNGHLSVQSDHRSRPSGTGSACSGD